MMAVGGSRRAGNLRNLITVERTPMVDDGLGGTTPAAAPEVYRTLRAQVEGQDGREAVIAHALEGISTYRIAIRYRTDLLETDQIRLDTGKLLNITSISDPEGRRRELQIIATTQGAVTVAG
jgi:SPP1 family predicted phage head-tail adaptor